MASMRNGQPDDMFLKNETPSFKTYFLCVFYLKSWSREFLQNIKYPTNRKVENVSV